MGAGEEKEKEARHDRDRYCWPSSFRLLAFPSSIDLLLPAHSLSLFGLLLAFRPAGLPVRLLVVVAA